MDLSITIPLLLQNPIELSTLPSEFPSNGKSWSQNPILMLLTLNNGKLVAQEFL
jgi:hypothetical protein